MPSLPGQYKTRLQSLGCSSVPASAPGQKLVPAVGWNKVPRRLKVLASPLQIQPDKQVSPGLLVSGSWAYLVVLVGSHRNKRCLRKRRGYRTTVFLSPSHYFHRQLCDV